MFRIVAAFSILSLTVATGASAQSVSPPAPPASPAPAQDAEILVTGKQLTPKVVHRYIREVSTTVDGQMSRVLYPVCPVVIGFPEDQAQIMVRRVRRIAKVVGAPVADAKCRGNVILIAAVDADALVAQFRKKTPGRFEGVDEMDLKRAFRPGPVHMWNQTMLLNEDNQQQTGSTFNVKSASIIHLPHRQVIAGSTIVIDNKVLVGKSLTQIADYVAMRALSGAKPPKEGIETDTIMTLFDPLVNSPYSVTEVDKSYLTALYKTDPRARVNVAMGRVSRQIRNDAAKRAEVE